MSDIAYLICFDFPEMPDPLFAGRLADGALGFAPTLKTAARFDDWEAAERTIANGYGGEAGRFASVVEVEVFGVEDVESL